MVKNEEYYFHQTPEQLAIKLIDEIDLIEGDTVLEPFKGEGSFYNNLPNYVIKHYTEIEEGLDYKDFNIDVDWVISNPPFKLDNNESKKRVNAFYYIIEYYSLRVNKGIAFLANDYCLSSLTPIRLKKLKENNLYLHKIVVCNIKKWRSRYFFIIFKKNEPSSLFNYIEGSF
jgi:hypothetical protein